MSAVGLPLIHQYCKSTTDQCNTGDSYIANAVDATRRHASIAIGDRL